MLLDLVRNTIASFLTNKEASKAVIDQVLTEHAAACADADQACQVARSEADRKLWETIRGHLDARGLDANEVAVKAGEFEAYAVMSHEESVRVAREIAEAAARQNSLAQEAIGRINPPPDAPKGVGPTNEVTP